MKMMENCSQNMSYQNYDKVVGKKKKVCGLKTSLKILKKGEPKSKARN